MCRVAGDIVAVARVRTHFEHEIDGGGGPALCMPAGGSLQPASHQTIDCVSTALREAGRADRVFKFAVLKTEKIARRLLERNGLTAADIDLFVSHQAFLDHPGRNREARR